MKFSAALWEQAEMDGLIIPVYQDQPIKIDWIDHPAFNQACSEFKAKKNEMILLYGIPDLPAKIIGLIGLGKKKDEWPIKSLAAGLKKIQNQIHTAGLLLDQISDEQIKALLIEIERSLNRFDQFKTEPADPILLKKIIFLTSPERLKPIKKSLKQAKAIAKGVKLAQNLANLPGNICTPRYLAEQAQKLADQYHIEAQILGKKAIKKIGMNALLGVSKGSHEPPRLIVLNYQGGGEQKPIVLVGKGLTFDAGGISLKPANHMDEMKYDMCGGASVLGTIKACAEMKLPINLVGIVPAAENLPDGKANKPGDILTSLSGKTIEVLNTDAEGRLILSDALSYAERFNPAMVIDIATLTGACIVALGHHLSALLGNDSSLMEQIQQAGNKIQDPVWPMPINDDYQEQIHSDIADVANIGEKGAGTITAACFLSRFTEDYRWAHLDIAGTAWTAGKSNGATGRPVPLLSQFLIDQCS